MDAVQDLERRLGECLAGVSAPAGVVHVAAVWRAPDGTLPVIRIGPSSPRSETDSFLLRAARVRADAIVTTGKILRDEPDLQHDELSADFLAWRREHYTKPLPPRSIVLSSGDQIDFDHALFRRTPATRLIVPHERVDPLEAMAAVRSAEVEIVGRRNPSVRDTLQLLREDGATSVLVEAGPSTTRDLYREETGIDELWLSVFEEPQLDAALVGRAFATESEIDSIFDSASTAVKRSEASGQWSFRRYSRRA